jgi:hypothetical protein
MNRPNDTFNEAINKAVKIVNYEQAKRQFVIYNPTGLVIKVGLSYCDTDHYIFIVNAGKMFVSPPLVFTRLYIVTDSFVDTLKTFASVYAYPRAIYTPQTSSIT